MLNNETGTTLSWRMKLRTANQDRFQICQVYQFSKYITIILTEPNEVIYITCSMVLQIYTRIQPK